MFLMPENTDNNEDDNGDQSHDGIIRVQSIV